MRKGLYIVFLVIGLTACGTTSQAPLDDAYFWPDEAVEAAPEVEESSAVQAVQAAPAYQVVNEQDTTITIRIKSKK